jgi:hypothetical protein
METEKARKHVADADKAAEEVPDRLAQLPDLEVRRLVNACYEDCVRHRINVQANCDKLHESEVGLLQATRALEEARVRTQALSEAHDSEKTRIQQENEEKLAFIIQQLQEEQARGSHTSPQLVRQIVSHLSPSLRSITLPHSPPVTASSPRGSPGERRRSPLEGLGEGGALSSPRSPMAGESRSSSGGSTRRNTLEVGKVCTRSLSYTNHEQQQQQQVSAVLRADTSGLKAILDNISRPATSPSTSSAASSSPSARAGVPCLPIGGMNMEDPDSAGARAGSRSAREATARREAVVEREAVRDGARTARAHPRYAK